MGDLDLKFQNPQITNQYIPQNLDWQSILGVPQPINWNFPIATATQNEVSSLKVPSNNKSKSGASILSNALSNLFSTQTENLFGDSEWGRGLGTLFSSGVNSTMNTVSNNLVKGSFLTQGLGRNVGASLTGTGAGLASNYIGKGINALGGNSMLSRGIGQGVATGLGTIGGTALQGALQGVKVGTKTLKGAQGAATALKAISPIGLGLTVAGSALGAAFGPSKEYGGKYGGITQAMDTAYDTITAGVNFIPGAGQVVSGALALNKGLSNIFGSTDGMTVTDSILGSAFMPAPVKWLNMWGANTTSSFNNQSWQNSEKTKSFMGNAFGNLQDKFDQAKEEAGKTYGLFSQGAYSDAQKNINFANRAWDQVLAMADQNELQNIRSQYMSSINNQRYAQGIQGGWSPLARGKYGMKILNNATNHNIGMRLLSGAALIDNKQMILCSVVD